MIWLICVLVASVVVDIDQFTRQLRERGDQRIAVFPELIQVDQGGQYRFADERRQSIEEMARVRQRLLRSVGDQVNVLPMQDVQTAVNGQYFAKDIGDDEKMRGLCKRIDVDTLVIGIRESSNDGGLTLRLREIQAVERAPAVLARVESKQSLSDHAFRGRSFEVRRWRSDGKLVHVGFRDIVRTQMLDGLGIEHERNQTRFLKSDLPHPLETQACPFRIKVVVKGEHRPYERVGDDYFVELNQGEQPEFWFQNRSNFDSLLGFYIDGENTIGKKAEHPERVPTSGHWVLPARSSVRVRGWYCSKPHQEGELQPFVVRDMPDTKQRAAGDPSGTITAIFYSSGTADIEMPLASVTRGAVDIEGGEPEPLTLRTRPGNKGLMMASISIKYRSAEDGGKTTGL